jgi:hypothetical protein
MTRPRMLILLVIAGHWAVAIAHLFLAASVVTSPDSEVSWVAVTLISLGHASVSVALWKLGDRIAGWASLFFFLAASGADLYEHFLHTSANNIFMVAPGNWTPWFDASICALLALEILGCLLSIRLLGGKTRNAPRHPAAKAEARAGPNKISGLKKLRVSDILKMHRAES